MSFLETVQFYLTDPGLFSEDALIPADLSKKIIFSKTKSLSKQLSSETQCSAPKKSKKAKRNKIVLSFNEDEEDQ